MVEEANRFVGSLLLPSRVPFTGHVPLVFLARSFFSAACLHVCISACLHVPMSACLHVCICVSCFSRLCFFPSSPPSALVSASNSLLACARLLAGQPSFLPPPFAFPSCSSSLSSLLSFFFVFLFRYRWMILLFFRLIR